MTLDYNNNNTSSLPLHGSLNFSICQKVLGDVDGRLEITPFPRFFLK